MKVFKTRGRARSRDAAYRASRIIAGGAAGAFVALLMFGTGQAQAARHLRYHAHARHGAVGFGPVRVSESIVIDADTGQVLGEMNADAVTYPASLTKMMTLYLTFEALNAGKLQLDQYLPVSAEAANKSPTKLHLLPGDSVQVQDLILGVVTRSANDAAAVLAEGMAGSEWAFAERMTQKARQLGMTTTVYRNASGLPDPEQYTTARDVAQLSLALYHDFPREYRYFSTRQFYFRGNFITNHNRLLEWYEGADGIKTGYIGASGFNLAASAVRNGHRLIGVIMGGPSAGARDREMAALLDQGFAEVDGGAVVARREAPAVPQQVVAEAEPPRPVSVPDLPPAASTAKKPGLFSKAARKLVAGLSPIAKAEAAPISHHLHAEPATEHWSIQLGAFRVETAAEQAARSAASLPVAKDKPLQIVQPSKGGKDHLYRARLLNFTSQEAQTACATLHKKKIECSVIPPTRIKVAAR